MKTWTLHILPLILLLQAHPAGAASYPDRFVWIFGWSLSQGQRCPGDHTGP